jgi:hypothetical protein
MQISTARLRAIAISGTLLIGLAGASSVSAAETPTATVPPATVAGTGVLAAQGDGRVRLGGSYVLAGSLDGGTLRIDGAGVFSSIRVTGWISKTRLADGSLVYRFGEATGHFLIAGRTIVTRIESHSMRFSAGGHGRAWLIGAGTYWVNGMGPFLWTAPSADSTATVTPTTF